MLMNQAGFVYTEIKKVENAIENHFLSKFKYPKILALLLMVVLAVLLAENQNFTNFASSLGELSYIGSFIGGILFSFGFTSPFAGAFFVDVIAPNIFIAALIGGVGAMLGDLLIFKIIRFSFKDEFAKIKHEKLLKEIKLKAQHTLGKRIMRYIAFAFAGFVIACPVLPDEAGVTLIAGLSHINEKQLAIISYICNTLGILAMLLI
ncbi:SNARE associated Golgi protein [uncultured archaeon]|nr:SNARE associated Golgi protein [uncultured archaeon]